MKCILCNQRKPKRFCPAREQMICTHCCGEKRVLEIDCPETCQYLQSGREHELELYRRHLYTPDPANQQKQERVFGKFTHFLSRVEYTLAEERQASRDFRDRHAADALDLVLDTLRTEDKGVLYERTSNDLRTDIVRRKLMEAAKSARSPEGPRGGTDLVAHEPERMVLRDVIESLEVIRAVLQRHVDEGTGPLGYVDFLARLMPRRGRVEAGGSSLIIPGR
jgi:hypothetical protein